MSLVFGVKKSAVRGVLRLEIPVQAKHCVFRGPCFVGAYSYIGHHSEVHCATIGRYCSIGNYALIGLPNTHDIAALSTHLFAAGSTGPFTGSREFAALRSRSEPGRFNRQKPVTIGADVWIGTGAMILGGVSIGHGAVIGANAVVSRDVPPYAIVRGVPAKISRYRFDADTIARMLALEWWTLDLASLPEVVDFTDAEGAMDRIEAANLPQLNPVKRTIQPSA